MPFLHNFTFENEKARTNTLGDKEAASLAYHDIFDYPLTFPELIRWGGGRKLKIHNSQFTINQKGGFYFLKGNEGNILKRLLRERISIKKLRIARKYGKIFSFIPTIKLAGITGALAMENADENSDIDFLLVTQAGTLWLTRLFTSVVLMIFGVPLRRFNDKNPKDKLCLNMWLDESNMVWSASGRNAYTAHEIAQIKPIVNKENTYERLISKNKWIKDYWPNAVKDKDKKIKSYKEAKRRYFFIPLYLFNFVTFLFEKLAFQLQYQYMKSKITRETITKTRALFHPNDWGKIVLQRLNS